MRVVDNLGASSRATKTVQVIQQNLKTQADVSTFIEQSIQSKLEVSIQQRNTQESLQVHKLNLNYRNFLTFLSI